MASPWRAMVPKRSSPSHPSMAYTGTLMASSSSCTMGNCSESSGSRGGRWALYWGSMSMRTWGAPLSNATTTPSGWKSSMSLSSIETKPNRALVGRPSGAFMLGGIAWYARCMSELPSMTA